MIQQAKKTFNLISNMGLRYVFFRVFFSLKTKIGWQKKIFPINPESKSYISLEHWRENLQPFFFYGKKINGLEKKPTKIIKSNYLDIKKNIFTFFNKEKIKLTLDYDWITNPLTNYKYNINTHWSKIEDLSSEAGDIKYVWEKARFSFLYDIIRYDYHFDEDQSNLVFNEIEDFINKNPINQGPNYKCSQEISLRILNWTFALYYYKDSERLTETLFTKIMYSVYWQIHHVFHNIHFSRIAVRNNHAITETLMLYLSDKLFPFFPNVKSWSKKGKYWFEQEIKYQIYTDGTFLQFSMNYHRVAVQLLTWGIKLSKLNDDVFDSQVYDRAKKSLIFLDACSDPVSGKLPNYGSNDGALFFKLTDDDYRVYRSQLDDLRSVLSNYSSKKHESIFWYGVNNSSVKPLSINELNEFNKGGYFIIQENNTKTFIRCGSYKDRPFQSDNLHLDIWVNGVNYLRDNGSFKYNTKVDYLNYFTGTEGHNTVSVKGENQMKKGSRFIWYYWVKESKASLKKTHNYYEFNGYIKAFKHIRKNIIHNRIVKKYFSENVWEITDTISNTKSLYIYQYWHLNPDFLNHVDITTMDEKGNLLSPLIEEKWYSSYYGIKERSIRITYKTKGNKFTTKINIIDK